MWRKWKLLALPKGLKRTQCNHPLFYQICSIGDHNGHYEKTNRQPQELEADPLSSRDFLSLTGWTTWISDRIHTAMGQGNRPPPRPQKNICLILHLFRVPTKFWTVPIILIRFCGWRHCTRKSATTAMSSAWLFFWFVAWMRKDTDRYWPLSASWRNRKKPITSYSRAYRNGD